MSAVVVDLDGRPQAGVKVKIDQFSREYFSIRKKLVGGFFGYESSYQTKRLGPFYEGVTDSKGYFVCAKPSAKDGEIIFQGEPVHLASPHDARAMGIETVYQDLATVPLMSVARNFFMGREPTRGFGPFRRLDLAFMDATVRRELANLGIEIRDSAQPVGTLSGGERQSLAIARAVFFGARVLILDEPTSALGVHQASVVLRLVARARARGLGVILITHNVQHAWPVGDVFTLLDRGKSLGTFHKGEISRERLTELMAGGRGLVDLAAELEALGAGRSNQG